MTETSNATVSAREKLPSAVCHSSKENAMLTHRDALVGAMAVGAVTRTRTGFARLYRF